MRATKQWLILRWRQLSFYSNKLNKIIYKSLFTPIQNELGLQPSSEIYFAFNIQIILLFSLFGSIFKCYSSVYCKLWLVEKYKNG